MVHYYCIEKLAFCALIKYIFKTDLQKIRFHTPKNFVSVHIPTPTLKSSSEISDKKEMVLVSLHEKIKLKGDIKSVYMISSVSRFRSGKSNYDSHQLSPLITG